MPALAESHKVEPAAVLVSRHATKLNIGCGPVQPLGWVNVDGSNRAWLASRLPWIDRLLTALGIVSPTEFTRRTVAYDVRRGIRESDNAVACIYAGEFLEHLTRDEAARFLAECHRVLAPRGVLRIRVPDNYEFWSRYIAEYEQERRRPASGVTEEPAHMRWVEMFFHDICVRRPWLGSMGHFHKWMYDEISLTRALARAGFTEIERQPLHVSRIPDVAVVENRFDLIMECVKPANDPEPEAS